MDQYTWFDTWPKNADGIDYDGKNLMTLLHNETSPFKDLWDVKLLLQEIEKNLGAKVVDIPKVYRGSNNYVRMCIIQTWGI